MVEKVLEIAFRGFWPFIGVTILITGCFRGFIYLIVRFMRMITMSVHGYPPPHCDADGDFKEELDTKNKENK